MEGRFRFYKIIETPTTTEIYEYDKPISRGGGKDESDISDDALEETEKDKKKSSKYDRAAAREKQMKDNRWTVARIIECNKGAEISEHGERLGMKFLTLTIAENNEQTQDVKWCNREFSKFMRRLNRHLYGSNAKMQLQYLAVNEQQKRGVWHYHLVLFHFPFVPKDLMESIWGLGFIDIRSLENDKEGEPIRLDIATYISKYFTKDVVRGYKQKTFFKSQNLQLPKETRIALPEDRPLEIPQEAGTEVYSKEYDRPYFDCDSCQLVESKVRYRKFNKVGRSEDGTGADGR